MKALECIGLKKSFGGVAAVDDLSFSVEEREAVGIIGPNGAGKTTVFNLITGLYRPSGGQVRFFGEDITAIDPARPVTLGIARTFQNLRLFKSLTVLDNVMVPILVREGYGPAGAILLSRRHVDAERNARQRAMELLGLFRLAGKAHLPAGSLPYGEQRRLELSRALAAAPRLLLIDEPGAGMNPREIQGLLSDIREIKENFGLTILIIEHQMGLVMRLSDRLVVMDFGRKIAEGTPGEIKKDPDVIRAYLGASAC
jgi:branched-chain amino acid transport system ATP-binding protein